MSRDSQPRSFLAKTNLPHPDAGQFVDVMTSVRERLLMLDSGQHETAIGATLHGAPRTGKTEMAKRIGELVPELMPRHSDHVPVVEISLSGGSDVKTMYEKFCDRLSVPVGARENSTRLLAKLRRRFMTLGTRLVKIDEAHDALTGGKLDMKLANAIKTEFLDYKLYPISVVLIGLPTLWELVESDPQLAGRMRPVRIRTLMTDEAVVVIRDLIRLGCERADLQPSQDLEHYDVAERLARQAGGAFGLIVDILDEALRHTQRRGDKVLSYYDIAKAHRLWTGTRDGDGDEYDVHVTAGGLR